MRYIEAPESLTSLVRPAVFLAGGITNCPDWQSDVLLQLEEEPRLQDINFSVLNPRRKDFDTSVTDAAEKQIEWEWNALRTVDIRLFWFPSCDSAQTVTGPMECPIRRAAGRDRLPISACIRRENAAFARATQHPHPCNA